MISANAMVSITNENGHVEAMTTYRSLLRVAREMMTSGDAVDRYEGIQLLDDLYRL